jgi:hypothetical protein
MLILLNQEEKMNIEKAAVKGKGRSQHESLHCRARLECRQARPGLNLARDPLMAAFATPANQLIR